MMVVQTTNEHGRAVAEIHAEGLRYYMGEGTLNKALARLSHDLDSTFIEIVGKACESFIERSFTHKIAQTFGVNLSHRPPVLICRLHDHHCLAIPGVGPKIVSKEIRKPGNMSGDSR